MKATDLEIGNIAGIHGVPQMWPWTFQDEKI